MPCRVSPIVAMASRLIRKETVGYARLGHSCATKRTDQVILEINNGTRKAKSVNDAACTQWLNWLCRFGGGCYSVCKWQRISPVYVRQVLINYCNFWEVCTIVKVIWLPVIDKIHRTYQVLNRHPRLRRDRNPETVSPLPPVFNSGKTSLRTKHRKLHNSRNKTDNSTKVKGRQV